MLQKSRPHIIEISLTTWRLEIKHHNAEKIYCGSQTLERTSFAENWNISGVPVSVLSENVMFTLSFECTSVIQNPVIPECKNRLVLCNTRVSIFMQYSCINIYAILVYQYLCNTRVSIFATHSTRFFRNCTYLCHVVDKMSSDALSEKGPKSVYNINYRVKTSRHVFKCPDLD